MRGLCFVGSVLGALAGALLLSGCAATGIPGDQPVLRAKDQVMPALVHIQPVQEVFAQGRREQRPIVGSGFIISPEGYVVTNEHVAGRSGYVRCVLYDRREMDAEVIGTDRYTDIAVLKLQTEGEALPYVRMGESAALQAGQTVLAMGSPLGLSRSVSRGIISVPDRHIPDHGTMTSPYNNWIQTDAAINQGNSGGPLVNLRGEVIGVNARIIGGADNIGFAIPIDIAKEVVDALIADGHVSRSWIGVTLQEMRRRTDDPGQRGVVIGGVDPMSPAQEAGVLPGDILLTVDGQAVDARFEEDLPAVRKRIADIAPGSAVTIQLLRGGAEIDLEVETMALADLRGVELAFAEWGFTAAEVTPEIARRAQLPAPRGVLVSGVQPGGPAANSGLQHGDIVLEIDEEPVENMRDFEEMYADRIETGQRLVLFDVKSGPLMRYVLIDQSAVAGAPQPGMEDLPPEENGLMSPELNGGLDGLE